MRLLFLFFLLLSCPVSAFAISPTTLDGSHSNEIVIINNNDIELYYTITGLVEEEFYLDSDQRALIQIPPTDIASSLEVREFIGEEITNVALIPINIDNASTQTQPSGIEFSKNLPPSSWYIYPIGAFVLMIGVFGEVQRRRRKRAKNLI